MVWLSVSRSLISPSRILGILLGPDLKVVAHNVISKGRFGVSISVIPAVAALTYSTRASVIAKSVDTRYQTFSYALTQFDINRLGAPAPNIRPDAPMLWLVRFLCAQSPDCFPPTLQSKAFPSSSRLNWLCTSTKISTWYCLMRNYCLVIQYQAMHSRVLFAITYETPSEPSAISYPQDVGNILRYSIVTRIF
jgi:hypothetical protein